MKKTLLKAAARAAVPKLAEVLHSRKSPMQRATGWASGQMQRPRRSSSTVGSTALKGLGAAAVALPLGMWIGRKLLNRSGTRS